MGVKHLKRPNVEKIGIEANLESKEAVQNPPE